MHQVSRAMTPRPLQARWDVLLDESNGSGVALFEDPGERKIAQMGETSVIFPRNYLVLFRPTQSDDSQCVH